MKERISSQEFSDLEIQLIRKLKERESDENAAKEFMNVWLKGEEAKTDLMKNARANIELSLKRARMYYAAGMVDEALENLDATMLQASQEGEADLYDRAKSIMDEIEHR